MDNATENEEVSQQSEEKMQEDCSTEVKLSKRQRKRLRKTEKWLETKHQKRADERQRKKERRKLKREQGIDLGPSRKSLKHNTMATSSCKVKVVVDCSFDDLMNDKDIGNVVKQLNHCYAANRRSENPLQFYTTSVEKKLQHRLDNQQDTKYWDMHRKNESYEKIFDKKDIVYLSSDSDNVLDTLHDDKVYVIGGLVDHNHHKGLCHQMAVDKGLYHAKLPISEYVHFISRKVLTINQVFEILLGYTETHNWEEAFLKALPKRKGAVTKGTSSDRTEDSKNSNTQDNSNTSSSEEPDKEKYTESVTSNSKVTEVTDNSINNSSCQEKVEAKSARNDCDEKLEKQNVSTKTDNCIDDGS